MFLIYTNQKAVLQYIKHPSPFHLPLGEPGSGENCSAGAGAGGGGGGGEEEAAVLALLPTSAVFAFSKSANIAASFSLSITRSGGFAAVGVTRSWEI